MSATISALDQGHEHASNAADYYSRGLLIDAAKEHRKAAEAFQTCVDQSTDEHTKSTLRKLCTHHKSVAKDLSRRIERLKEEGKDPSQPQISLPPRPASGSRGAAPTLQASQHGRNMDSSTGTVDESFMVLHQQAESGTEDSPFDTFWKVTGEIMVNLSQPMSFPAAAMAALDAVDSRTASTQSNQPDSNDVAVGSSKVTPQKNGVSSATLKEPNGTATHDEFELDEDGYDSFDDFCLVPSSADDSPATTRLKKENKLLKSKLEAIEKQMASVRRQITLRNEQDQHLRDNIALARKEAQRAMAASTSFAPSAHSMMNLTGAGQRVPQPPQPTIGRDREAQLLRRTRELEEDVRNLRLDNEKQKAMIAKFRERWERLKESAKRKKSAKAAGRAESSSVRESIDEEPEAEAAAAAEDYAP